MLYKEFLTTITTCPFCEPIANEVIAENEKAFLTYSIAPYHKHHIMVVPRRHTTNFKELDSEEVKCIEDLLHAGAILLEALNYSDYTILVRNGKNVGKSIAHIHYHIVPSINIGDLDHYKEERRILTANEIKELLDEFKKAKSSTQG